MKTLDEVIDNFEKACDLELRCEGCSGCLGQEYGCPNDGAECVPDALHYLKEYREKLNILEVRMAEYKRGFEQLGAEWSRIKDNPPLTWEGLKAMERKPVWVEMNLFHPRWYIIESVNDEKMICIGAYSERVPLYRNDDGDVWRAYLKERK